MLKKVTEQEVELNQDDLNNLSVVFATHRKSVAENREQTIASLDLEERVFNFIFQELKKKEVTKEEENTKEEE